MTRLELLRQKNPDLEIHTVDEPMFSRYARLVSSPVFGTLSAFIAEYTTIPERNTYVADVLELHTPEIDSALCAFYGGLVPQIGYCNGKNFSMNGSEYHKGPELTIAVTDCLMWWMLPEDLVSIMPIRREQKSSISPKDVPFFLSRKSFILLRARWTRAATRP
jgi:hypothetical protein